MSEVRTCGRIAGSQQSLGLIHLGAWVFFMVAGVVGCSGPEVRQTAEPLQVPTLSTPVPAEPAANPYRELPDVEKLARALEKAGTEYGLQFFRNRNGFPLFYSARTREAFAIADRTGNCLYEVRILPPDSRRKRSGDDPDLPVLDVTPGPCGLSFPDMDPTVKQSVVDMETLLVYPALVGWLDGSAPLPVCSPEGMIQEMLPVPFRMVPLEGAPEEWLWNHAEPLTDPFDLSFGDIVAFGEDNEPSRLGIYTGHGLVVYYEGCEKARLHRMGTQHPYRAYRLFNGFSWSGHVLSGSELLKRYTPESSYGQTIQP